MTPAVSQVLADLAGRVARNAAPNVPAADRAGELGLSALLLGLAAEMWDGAAEILVQENTDLRALLAAGAKVWGEESRRRWLEALAQGRDESLRLSALQSWSGGTIRPPKPWSPRSGAPWWRPATGDDSRALRSRVRSDKGSRLSDETSSRL